MRPRVVLRRDDRNGLAMPTSVATPLEFVVAETSLVIVPPKFQVKATDLPAKGEPVAVYVAFPP